ncbi:uncharacterized protein BDW43DRAFT_308663 [Aspergillus alliaceus]|uniref:uncharacterized protein n=1 Tax=Petromyces alliaceus TaxID=209559 RepID=UPI0012A5CCA0|nr:uncharacterized protein BDW43DRAFT_308663 [Aspergillus alliaceus]KAB8235852.1 hypothetical protein BDW43DRAFT_308663 [Aspergillus alliaceus]
MADDTPRVSGPGCLVSIDDKNLINGSSSHLDLARGELQAVKNALHLEGPLRGDPGTRLSPDKKYSALDTGYNNLDSLVYSLKDALENVKAAMNLMRKRWSVMLGFRRRQLRTGTPALETFRAAYSASRNIFP